MLKIKEKYIGMSELARRLTPSVSPAAIRDLVMRGKLTRQFRQVKNDRKLQAYIKKHEMRKRYKKED